MASEPLALAIIDELINAIGDYCLQRNKHFFPSLLAVLFCFGMLLIVSWLDGSFCSIDLDCS